ncbi:MULTISPECIES: hypothetical protein [Terrabacteria group]|uniref:hypothetical protein n=1 Tax=Bacillati TaxID=1783272 RepID=UPI001C6E0FED|nr:MULTISPECIES: hypothetical protein [Terrabacteria group]MBW9212162.1 hypothetical protein [Trueperella sp. zg.1013]
MNSIVKKSSMAILTILSLSACTLTQKPVSKTEPEKKEVVETKVTTYEKDTTTTVLVDDTNIQKSNITKIVKHGDHWHVYTKDGKEHITYTNPSHLKDANHLDLIPVITLKQLKTKKVVSIKVHGNHWHVYTADGKEYLTYQNPSSLFKKIKITKYEGSHHPKKPSHSMPNLDSKPSVYKILKHGDHYHIYTTDGGEFITHQDPRPFYPNAKYGEYKGNHADHPTNKPKNPKALLPKPSVPNQDKEMGPIVGVLRLSDLKGKNITKIVDHGDHFHVYENGKEIGITKENPKAMFPKAEYIPNETKPEKQPEIKDKDKFTYEDVKERFDKKVEKVLSKNLQKMTHYGMVTDGLAVFGIQTPDKNGKYFYWLHDSHYHAISINDIIAMEKQGYFNGVTAKEVVAFLKYKVNHGYEIKDKIDTEEEMEAKAKFIADYYKVPVRRVRWFLGNYVIIVNGDELVRISASDLSYEDGVVKALTVLPKMKELSK